MKKSFTVLLFGIALGCVSCPTRAGLLVPTPEGSAAVKGTMVDSVTGKPLSGVIIVATWHDFTPNYLNTQIEGGQLLSCYQVVNVLTTVSGPDGSYEFPAWMGKLGHCQFMAVNQPFIVFYKPGYRNLATADVPADKTYVPGPDYTVSDYGGRTPMQPLGPHMFGYQDNHVANLLEYAGRLRQAFAQDEKGPCFWKQQSPVLLMLFQEERRLSAYEQDGLDLFDDRYTGPMTGRCTDATAVASLKKEAEATQPESPILPYVRFTEMRGPGTSSGRASAPPQELQDYVRERGASASSADDKAVVYHVYMNPANPYYLAILADHGGGQTRLSADVPGADVLGREGIYGMNCYWHPLQTGASPTEMTSVPAASTRTSAGIDPAALPWSAWLLQRRLHAPASTTSQPYGRATAAEYETYQTEHLRYLREHPTPALPPNAQGAPTPVTAADTGCIWTVALTVSNQLNAFLNTPVGGHRDNYNIDNRTWTLTEHSLARPKEDSTPAILEIHGPDSLAVNTTLTMAGPRRWQLPPPGQAFTLSIGMGSLEADANEVCAQILPAILRLKLARDYAGYRLMRTSDMAAGTKDCPDVVTGDFLGKGTTDYAFHLLAYDLVQRLAVATPEGADWDITVLAMHGCLQPHPCALTPAAPGGYAKTSRQWRDPNAPPKIAGIEYGEFARLNATEPGFIETWNAPVAYGHFFVDGKWGYVTVDAPGVAATHPSTAAAPFAGGSVPIADKNVVYPPPPGLAVAPPADAILQSWSFPDASGSRPVYFSVTGADCELRVVSFGDNALRTDLYPCKMLPGSDPFSPIRQGKAQASVHLPEGQALLSFDDNYNSVTMTNSLASAALPDQTVLRYSFPWIPLIDITVADKPPLHLTVKGFDCELTIEGWGKTKCVPGNWNGRDFLLYADGSFLKDKSPIVRIMLDKTESGWRMREPYAFGAQIPAPEPPMEFGSIELKQDDLKDFTFDQKFLTGAQGFVADLQRYEASHPAYVLGTNDPKQWTGHLLHDQEIMDLLAKNGLTAKQLATGFLVLGLSGLTGGFPQGCENNATPPPGGKQMTPSNRFLCMHAKDFGVMAFTWSTLK